MMEVEDFIRALERAGLSAYTGVPCSYFGPLIDGLEGRSGVAHWSCSSEGEAMGLAGGLALSGRLPIVYMQDDGYGNAVNPLSSLQMMYQLPALLLVSWRGEPGKKDEPQHEWMGRTILSLLAAFEIPAHVLSGAPDELDGLLARSLAWLKERNSPFAWIVPKGYFNRPEHPRRDAVTAGARRLDYIALLAKRAGPADVLLGATGFTGRELYQSVDHPGKFYMMGSMGCLASIGLGIASQNPGRTVYVLDGDGALLMKMGTLSTLGHYRPDNLVHVCFDNHAYESTGGQKTTSKTTALATIAKACGYRSAATVETLDGWDAVLRDLPRTPKPLFAHLFVGQGTVEGLGRPKESPVAMRDSLKRHLG